jgi:peptide methionine sulfoxide reductase MsrA
MPEQHRGTHSAVAGAQQTEVAVLAGGCFWGIEDILRDVPGVTDTEVGYTGGWLENPTYHDTHDSKSGHAEAIRVTFDPAVLSYEDLLQQWFFRLHDPTTLITTSIEPASTWYTAEGYHQDYLRNNPGGYTCHYLRT